MVSNKKIGNKSEKECVELLGKKGYWVHIFSYSALGQPCDIIALQGSIAFLIDVKHTKSDLFSFNDIQPNQENCFQIAVRKNVSINHIGFAIYFEKQKEFHWMSYGEYIHQLGRGKKSVKYTELVKVDDIW